MKIYTDKNYGADIDGNRGHQVTEYELEYTRDETEEISEILFECGYTSEDIGSVEIEYQDIYIEVDLQDYFVELEKLERLD